MPVSVESVVTARPGHTTMSVSFHILTTVIRVRVPIVDGKVAAAVKLPLDQIHHGAEGWILSVEADTCGDLDVDDLFHFGPESKS